jgi:hypothetical protein
MSRLRDLADPEPSERNPTIAALRDAADSLQDKDLLASLQRPQPGAGYFHLPDQRGCALFQNRMNRVPPGQGRANIGM